MISGNGNRNKTIASILIVQNPLEPLLVRRAWETGNKWTRGGVRHTNRAVGEKKYEWMTKQKGNGSGHLWQMRGK